MSNRSAENPFRRPLFASFVYLFLHECFVIRMFAELFQINPRRRWTGQSRQEYLYGEGGGDSFSFHHS